MLVCFFVIDAQEKYFFLSLKYNISKIHLDTKCHLATVRRRGGIYFFRRKFMKKKLKMPKTKFEAIVFTAITAWMVVYVMNYINITVLVKTIKKVYFVEKKSWLLI